MEPRSPTAREAASVERLADVMSMLRTCDIVLGSITIALAVFATWFAVRGETQAWAAALAWSIPVGNLAWSAITQRWQRERADLIRLAAFLPVCALLFGGADGPLHHLRTPAIVMIVGVGVVHGVASCRPRLGYFATASYCVAIFAGAWTFAEAPSLTLVVDVFPIAIPGFIIALVAAKLGRSLADAHERRIEAEQGRVELEAANARLTAEIRRVSEMETELRLAQKLQAIGQLAAGIGHEINTPIQYVSDNVEFLRASFARVEALRQRGHELVAANEVGLAELCALEKRSRLDYLVTGIPKAFDAATQGLERIAKIVRALKLLAHRSDDERAAVDLGQLVLATLEVARGEYKLVAEIETELGELPPVLCSTGEIGQVLLNLIVNAAHAIADVVGSSGERGTIRACTRRDGDDAVVSISDTGGGIPADIRDRIFEPFFTTKEVGRGSGQGLAISRAIVDRHSGSVSLETSSTGTTFHVRLPLAA